MSAKVDDNFELSPAALWPCLIVFLHDPPPENFEQLTLGLTFIGQMVTLGIFFTFSPCSEECFPDPFKL